MDEDDHEKRHNANLAALAAVAVVIVIGVVLMYFLSQNLKTERCLEERRRGCDAGATSDP